MHIHILGIAGTFMGGVAALAKALGHRVTGCDQAVYPPMSDQLAALEIEIFEGFGLEQLRLRPDLFVIGNAMSRGNPLVEAILDHGFPYVSGPAWLSEHVLRGRWVVAISGTHGKTTTSAMVVSILIEAGLQPGYLVGGVAQGLNQTAALGKSPFFVIEADEYDTAFFDKRSKFVHYCPRTLVINNLEFDHADIFKNLEAIQTQFHHLVRTVPSTGLIISFEQASAVKEVLEKGCWTSQLCLSEKSSGEGSDGRCLRYQIISTDGSCFNLITEDNNEFTVNWPYTGLHNVANGVAAIAATRHVGVPISESVAILSQFKGVKRRLELIASDRGIDIYDDFAHHPTAIKLTLDGLRSRLEHTHRAKNTSFRIWCVIEPRSNTMKMGVHRDALNKAFKSADHVLFMIPPEMNWRPELAYSEEKANNSCQIFEDSATLVALLQHEVQPGDCIVLMSNGSFTGVRDVLPSALGLI